ncbi:MAG: hypothetical protein QNJ37_18240 [Crocosphaera sp.]|nr:hypothetical protein [Crocosphaera sp.]
MNFLMTSKGAININHIVNIYLAEVKKELSYLIIDVMKTDGSVSVDLAKKHILNPKVGDKILTIITIKTTDEPLTFKNQEAQEILNQFLSKIGQ